MWSRGLAIGDVFDQAEARDPDHRRTWVVLVDGANHQLDLISAEAERRNLAVHIAIDIIHVIEYLWAAAWTLHASGDKSAEAWVAGHARTILAGHAADAANQITAAAKTARLRGPRRKTLNKTVDYLRNKDNYLRYDTALTAGFPIATGCHRGGGRHLVKDRLDITGARWGLAGAEAVLKLRALRTNGDFDTYWTRHEQQELGRNHQARYRDQLIPAP